MPLRSRGSCITRVTSGERDGERAIEFAPPAVSAVRGRALRIVINNRVTVLEAASVVKETVKFPPSLCTFNDERLLLPTLVTVVTTGEHCTGSTRLGDHLCSYPKSSFVRRTKVSTRPRCCCVPNRFPRTKVVNSKFQSVTLYKVYLPEK